MRWHWQAGRATRAHARAWYVALTSARLIYADAGDPCERFEHVESNDIGTEAKAFCTEILSPGSKADARITRDAIEQCAGRIVAAARGKLIEQAVESEGDLGL